MKHLKVIGLVAVLIVCSGISSFANDFSDIENHWAESEINKWSESELISGYNGEFSPNAFITRAELAVIIDRLFKYQLASENTFDDVSNDWYTEAILKNNSKGVINGYDNNLRPLDEVTREEAIVMLSKGFGIASHDGAAHFKDDDEISDWASGYVNAMAELGYISGKSDRRFSPKDHITRAEIIKILDNSIGGYYHKSGEYSADVEGLVVVNTEDVVFKDMTIKGNLIVAEGVADGDFTMDNVTINGEMYVYGGGENSIKLYNTSIEKVIVSKRNSKVRIVSDGSINEVVIKKNALLIVDGKLSVEAITVGENAVIEIRKDVKVNNVNLEGKDVKAIVDGTVENMKVDKNAERSTVSGKGEVKKTSNSKEAAKVDSVSSASKSSSSSNSSSDSSKDKSSGGGSSSGGSSSGNSSSGNNSNNGETSNAGFRYTLENTFIGAPTRKIIVYKNNGKQVGYTLYVDGKEVAKDLDLDGEVTTISNYFSENSVIEFTTKDSLTKVKLNK